MSFNENLTENNNKQSPVSNDDGFHSNVTENSFDEDIRCKSDEKVIKSLKRKYDDSEDNSREKQRCVGIQYRDMNSWMYDEELKNAEVKDVLIELCNRCELNVTDEYDSLVIDEWNYGKESVQGSTLAQIYNDSEIALHKMSYNGNLIENNYKRSTESNNNDFQNTVSKDIFDINMRGKSDEKIMKPLKRKYDGSKDNSTEKNICADIQCRNLSVCKSGEEQTVTEVIGVLRTLRNRSTSDVAGEYDSVITDEKNSDKESVQSSRSTLEQAYSASQINIQNHPPRMLFNLNAIQNMHITESRSYLDKCIEQNELKNSIQSHLKSTDDHINVKPESTASETKPVSIFTNTFPQENRKPFEIIGENSVKPDASVSQCLSGSSMLFRIGDPEPDSRYINSENHTDFPKGIPEPLATSHEEWETLALNKNNETCQSIKLKTEHLPESPMLFGMRDPKPNSIHLNNEKRTDYSKSIPESLTTCSLEDSQSTSTFNENNEKCFKTNETYQSNAEKTEHRPENTDDGTIQPCKTAGFSDKENECNLSSVAILEKVNADQGKVFTDCTADFAKFGNMNHTAKEKDVSERKIAIQMPIEPQELNPLHSTLNASSTQVHLNSSSSELIKTTNIQSQNVPEQSQNEKQHEFAVPLTPSLIQPNNKRSRRKKHHSVKAKPISVSPEYVIQNNKCTSVVNLNDDDKIQPGKTVGFSDKENECNLSSISILEKGNADQGKIITDCTADFAKFGNMNHTTKEKDVSERNIAIQMPKEPQELNPLHSTLNASSTQVHLNSSSSELIKTTNIQSQNVPEQTQNEKQHELVPLTSPFIQPNNKLSTRKKHHSAMPKPISESPGYVIQELIKDYKEKIKLREFTIQDVVDYIVEHVPTFPYLKAMHESRVFFMNNLKNGTLVFKNGKYRVACNTLDTFVAENSERHATSGRSSRNRSRVEKMTERHQIEKSDELTDEVNENATISNNMSPTVASADHSTNKSGILEQRNDKNNLKKHEREKDLNKSSNRAEKLQETMAIDLVSEPVTDESIGLIECEDAHSNCQS